MKQSVWLRRVSTRYTTFEWVVEEQMIATPADAWPSYTCIGSTSVSVASLLILGMTFSPVADGASQSEVAIVQGGAILFFVVAYGVQRALLR